jgi:hypothetical protein
VKSLVNTKAVAESYCFLIHKLQIPKTASTKIGFMVGMLQLRKSYFCHISNVCGGSGGEKNGGGDGGGQISWQIRQQFWQFQ